jgi:hypothetical protein
MKVWFDQKDLKAVVCFDNSTPGGIANEACNNGEFHTHAWVPLGWLDMKTFVNAAAPADLAAAFLRELCMTIGRIRLSWEGQEQRIRNLTDEIERLREAIRTKGKSLRECQQAIARRNQRIEELELQDERMIPDGCCLITTEQIDAAWGFLDDLSDTEVSFFWDKVIQIVLEKLGIVRCPAVPNGCGGTGLSLGDTCPDCDGKGWVKR